MSNVSRVSWGAAMISLGIALPMAFHMVGLGSVFLPMHIPVLLCGLLTEPVTGAMVGFATPLLSAVLTGMPPLMPPIAQGMTVELALYGFIGSILHRNLRLNVYVSLIGAMLAGRLAYGLLGASVLPLLGLKAVSPLYPVTAGLLSSIPGLVLQVIAVPVIVLAAERSIASLRGRPVRRAAAAGSRSAK